MKFAVIGDPIAHSRSPAMHNAVYRALGLRHSYEKRRVLPADLKDAVDALRRGDYDGYNVTVPHKVDVISHVDLVAESAIAIGAANTLVRDAEGRVVAHNTDGLALGVELPSLVRNISPERCAIVLGTGGAARSALWALRKMGFGRVLVRGRRLGFHQDPDFYVEPLLPTRDDAFASIVVQTTSAGMTNRDLGEGEAVARAVDWAVLPDDAAAYEVIYGVQTPFLVAAKARGLDQADGSGMLAWQGALAFRLFLGFAPPVELMQAALTASFAS